VGGLVGGLVGKQATVFPALCASGRHQIQVTYLDSQATPKVKVLQPEKPLAISKV